MKSKVVEDAGTAMYVAVCDPGDEAVAALGRFAQSERLEAAQITAVGAFTQPTSAAWPCPLATLSPKKPGTW